MISALPERHSERSEESAFLMRECAKAGAKSRFLDSADAPLEMTAPGGLDSFERMAKKSVSLLSGGMDSSTATAIAVSQGYEVHALSFDYGQRHRRELEAAKAMAAKLGVVEHRIVEFDLSKASGWGGSSLTGDGEIPAAAALDAEGKIPSTYVPARNTIFLAFAASYAEAIGAEAIYIGVSQVDYSGYPDCREEYIRAMEKAINLGTRAGVESLCDTGAPWLKIEIPLIRMRKAEIIRTGLSLGVDYSLTWSCYRGEELACGECDSCVLRLRAFEQVGIPDPISYRLDG